jgi:glycosyltransferase involved in cell wall biosynthesis
MLISTLDASDGGPPQAVLGLAHALVEHGHAVTIVTHRRRSAAPHPDATRAVAAGVRIRWVDRERRTRFQFSPRLLRVAKQEASGADVVVAHGFYQFTGIAAYLTALRTDRPLVLQPHGVFEPYQEHASPKVKRAFMATVGSRVMRRVSAIVATSDAEAVGIAATLGGEAPPVIVAGLGVELPDGVASADGGRFSQRTVVFLSRVATKKRLDKLLDAAAILATRGRPIRVTVCGDGDPAFIDALKAGQPAGIDVEWRGHVVDPERAAIEAGQALFCLPSDNENFGQAVTEAMARGLPVITTRATGASMHVENADSGWVLDDPTATDLADTIDAALSDPVDLAERARRGVTYAHQELTWAAVAQTWLEFASSSLGANVKMPD